MEQRMDREITGYELKIANNKKLERRVQQNRVLPENVFQNSGTQGISYPAEKAFVFFIFAAVFTDLLTRH